MSALAQISPTLSIDADPRGLGGLIGLAAGAERPLPLESVRVRTQIVGGCARTIIEQRYHNPLTEPLEAIHLFPLPEDGAVIDLHLVCGDLEVRADLKEKAEAQRDFDQARASGHRAALLTQERADVHTLRLTRLPPGEGVRVRVEVVEFLPFVDGAWRWRFPTTIAPRYLPGAPIGHAGPGHLPDTDHVPDASWLQPPIRLEGGTTLDLEVHLVGDVHQVESNQHAVKVGLDGGGLRIAPSGAVTCDADFVLAVTSGPRHATAARAWTDGHHTLVQVEPPVVDLPEALPRDAVFVLDISGSMGGRKLQAARKALQSALHGLEPGDRFQLIAFDDRLEHFTQSFVPYTDDTLHTADAWIQALLARGGTEMLPAIQAALAGERPAGRLRTVLFITDGQAWNEAELVAAVAHRREGAVFFTLGIDSAVNGGLLGRLARVGGGTCELATPQDDIDEVIARLEGRFGSPVADGLAVDGAPSASMRPAVVFAGRPATLLIEGAPGALTVASAAPCTRWAVTAERVDFPLGALWARRRLAALDDRLMLKPFEAEALRPEMIRVSLAHRVICPFTAYIAVERTRVVDGAVQTVVQPAERPRSWDEQLRGTGGARGGGRAMAKRAVSAAMAPPEPSPMAMDAMEMEQAAEAQMLPPAPRGQLLSRARKKSKGAPAPRRPSRAVPAPAKAEPHEGAAAPAGAAAPTDVAAALARLQGADGSFGGDVARTAAALLTLVKLGHTRRKGARRRTVAKAARWLQGHLADPQAALAVSMLELLEAGHAPTPGHRWQALTAAGLEGQMLALVLAG